MTGETPPPLETLYGFDVRVDARLPPDVALVTNRSPFELAEEYRLYCLNGSHEPSGDYRPHGICVITGIESEPRG